MRLALLVLLAGLSAPLCAADDTIEIDANTKIRVDPKLKTVIGTDTAAAGGGARERALEELKAGSDAPAEGAIRREPQDSGTGTPARKDVKKPR